jgi:hypothetical protein
MYYSMFKLEYIIFSGSIKRVLNCADKSQRRSSKYFDSDDDTLSTSSTGALSDRSLVQEIEDVESEDTALEGYLDSMYEKR